MSVRIKKSKIKRPGRGEAGFTFIELVLVIVLIGILASTAAQKMISVAEEAEIAAENTTIEILRRNIFHTFGESLLRGDSAEFPENPFSNLTKVPDGFDRRRVIRPTGEPVDDDIWVYVRGSNIGQLTPEDAGTTLPTFRTDGFIFHQRRDSTIVKWPYDSSSGVIGKKIIERESDEKIRQDLDRRRRGERTEQDRLIKTR